MELIGRYCAERKLSTDQLSQGTHETTATEGAAGYIKPKAVTGAKAQAFELFRKGWSIDDVKHKINRAQSTTCGYLAEFITEEKPRKIDCWVSTEVYRRVAEAAASVEERRLRRFLSGWMGEYLMTRFDSC